MILIHPIGIFEVRIQGHQLTQLHRDSLGQGAHDIPTLHVVSQQRCDHFEHICRQHPLQADLREKAGHHGGHPAHVVLVVKVDRNPMGDGGDDVQDITGGVEEQHQALPQGGECLPDKALEGKF